MDRLNAERVTQGVWRLPVAVQTLPPFDHTNSYLVASRGVGMIIDAPAEGMITALDALLEQAEVSLIKAVLLTHTHQDHCRGAKALQARLDAPFYVHPLERERLELTGPVKALQDGRVMTVGEITLQALHTPGHSPGHLSFYLPERGTLVAGDMVAGVGSSWVGAPEGDIAAYLKSLDRLEVLAPAHIGPGHGPVICEPIKKLQEVRTHRLRREQQVLQALSKKPQTLADLRATIYPQLHERVVPLAERSILAHLQKLVSDARVRCVGEGDEGPYTVGS